MSATQTAVSKTKNKKPPVETKALVASPPVDLSAWGVQEHNLTARDVVIPKILAMQAMSKLVTAGEAKFGEFRESLNNVILGTEKEPLEFVPFHMEKVYVVMREEKGKFKFHHQEPITSMTEGHEFEAVSAEGAKEKWYRTMNFYVLLPKELEEGTAIPYLLCFRSSSAKAGQKLCTTMFMRNLKAGKTPAAMVLELSGVKTTNDKGTFIVMDVKEKRASTNKEIEEAFSWNQTIRGGSVKVDHSDLEAESSGAAAGAAPESTEF